VVPSKKAFNSGEGPIALFILLMDAGSFAPTVLFVSGLVEAEQAQ
jgi:hypothetical protein